MRCGCDLSMVVFPSISSTYDPEEIQLF